MCSGERKTPKQFLDIPSAAAEAGFSSRHFRRIIEEQGIPVIKIGRKLFVLTKDVQNWQLRHSQKKSNAADVPEADEIDSGTDHL